MPEPSVTRLGQPLGRLLRGPRPRQPQGPVIPLGRPQRTVPPPYDGRLLVRSPWGGRLTTPRRAGSNSRFAAAR